MTATISNKLQWRFKSSMDLLYICTNSLLVKGTGDPEIYSHGKKWMNEHQWEGQQQQQTGISLASWLYGWEVSERFGVCTYKLSPVQDGACWKWGLTWSFNMKTWWLISHLLDFVGWALSSLRGILPEEACLCCLTKGLQKSTKDSCTQPSASLKMQKWANILFVPKHLGCLCTSLSLILPIPFAPIFFVSLSPLLASLYFSLKYILCSKAKKKKKIKSQSEGLTK